MSDLFIRLAQRARAEAALTVTAEVDPDFSSLDEEVPESEAIAPVADSHLTTAADPSEPASSMDAEGTAEKRTISRPVDAEIRLVPMPVVVPPSAPLARSASAPRAEPSTPAGSLAMRPPAALAERPRSVAAPSRRADSLTATPAPLEAKPVAAAVAESDRERPSIDITVGRIEVRVRPPAPVRTVAERRPAEPTPALTLAEYLRQREVPS